MSVLPTSITRIIINTEMIMYLILYKLPNIDFYKLIFIKIINK
jgi:hypothetical protein